jgi:hypothetical protein
MSMTDPSSASTLKAIDIMLVSHTNVGKTTLVRTLIGKDVGEVFDAPDVTKAVTSYDLMVDESTGALRLWDTPGFGDSFRLAKRLRQKYRWVAWIVREIWDRYQNPRLWRSQRVALDLRERAAVILYLVNSLERPVDANYVAPELEVLAWTGKPVLAILNQSGTPLPVENESLQMLEWWDALASFPVVRKTVALDSYTRCWVQELILYDEIGHLLQEPNHAIYTKLATSIQADHYGRLDASIEVVAEYLLHTASDRVELDTGWFQSIIDRLREIIPWGDNDALQPHEVAMQSLAQRFMDETKTVTDKLIAINRLGGVSSGEIVEKAGASFSIDGPIDESTSAFAGGVISGALTGLAVDLHAGGLTLGTGALVGAVLGALGAGALAKGYNAYTEKGKTIIRWSRDSLTQAFFRSVMLYLAIAHFGRGQGEWRRKDDPEHWNKAVGDSVNRYQDRLQQLWIRTAGGPETQQIKHECTIALKLVLVEVLERLYPETRGHIAAFRQ